MRTGKLWGKRFKKEPATLAENFTSGRDVREISPADERLVPYDIWGSRAHVLMLARKKILPKREARALIKGLKEVEKFWIKGDFHLDPSKEDVHSNVETWLTKKYGLEVGGRLHTARSRNDQVVLDMRLYLRDSALDFIAELTSLVNILANNSQKHRDVIFPGYTHHQPAQVTTLGNVWLSFAEAFLRDGQRFQNWYERFNQNPLGSMTGYSTSFNIDRTLTSRLLGFAGPCQNSLDPIQNRWEPEAEMGFAIATMMNHLSSLAQTLILLSTGEFGMFRLDDAYCSGSSMMPQKRNPDPLEVIKAKTAVAQGLLTSLLSIGKALFLGYNRDTQWTKYLIMDLIDECFSAPRVISEIIASLRINQKEMVSLCRKRFIAAPDLLERIVQEWGVPFRKAKVAMERAVKYSEADGGEYISAAALNRALKEEGLGLKMDERGILAAQEPREIVCRRKTIGGSSPQALQKNFLSASGQLQILQRWLGEKINKQSLAKIRLAEMERNL
jgi:argininosuccinate lyase